jgi:hypothetical protein
MSITNITNTNTLSDLMVLTPTFYSKVFVRGISPFMHLDSGNNFISTPVYTKKKLSRFKNFKLGHQVNYQILAFKNKFYNLLAFKIGVTKFSNSYINVLSGFNAVLINLNKVHSKKASFFLLSPKKGGFKCIINGLIGFITKISFRKCLANRSKKVHLNAFYFLNSVSILSRFLYFATNLKVVMLPAQAIQPRFVKKFRFRKNRLNVLDIVFHYSTKRQRSLYYVPKINKLQLKKGSK